MLGRKVGVDLGSSTVRVHLKGEGVVAVEPALVARRPGSRRDQVLACGAAAAAAGDEGAEVGAVLDGCTVVDRLGLDALLRHVLVRACGRQRIFKPDVMVAVPSGLSGSDRRVVLEICAEAGARAMYLIDRPLAAALGAGITIGGPVGRAVLDAGAGSVDIAVIALDGAVARRCLPAGGPR